MKPTQNTHYRIKQFARDRWHVVSPDGIPVYDNAPYGKDKPLVFRDEDKAIEFADNCNNGT